jgi:hypothetical protein
VPTSQTFSTWKSNQPHDLVGQQPVKLQLLFLPLLVADSASAAPAPIMVTAWDSPTPAEFRQHLAEFEKWGVFYGTIPTRHSANTCGPTARTLVRGLAASALIVLKFMLGCKTTPRPPRR